MSIFFIGDTHFFHNNVIKYCNRPFKDSEEMNRAMIDNWNSVVKPTDHIYHVGDFGFAHEDKLYNVLKRLNGVKHLVWGNHDKIIRKSTLLRSKFESLSELKEIYVQHHSFPEGKQKIVLCHYSMRVWNKAHWGAYHLFGHSHGTLLDDPNSLSFDVGVDSWNFTPVSLEEVINKMTTKNFKPLDHHKQ